ncbi:MAG: 50S ribosomal protein L15e [archaeon]|nr:MAG: 50S ribosomal protein L15e [archaeon]
MPMYRQIAKTWQSIFHEKAANIRERAVDLRKEPAMLRVDRPWRLDRARALGYKAKEGVVVVRARVSRGGMRKQRPTSGRRPKHMGVLKIKSAVSSQAVAERRVSQRHPNLKLLGSYPVWEDGIHAWFECILVDPLHPAVRKDYNYRRVLGITT